MDRDIPYDENAYCDICEHKGAFDFMGDYLCEQCAYEMIYDVENYFEEIED